MDECPEPSIRVGGVNKQIDEFIILEKAKYPSRFDIALEWISYNQFENIKEISKNDFGIIYSAIWKDGPLIYIYDADNDKVGYKRYQENEKVILKYPYNLQNIDEFLNEVLNFLLI